MTQYLMIAWLTLVILGFAYVAYRPQRIDVPTRTVRTLGLIGVAGGFAEATVLWLGGFWG